jgi:hypothetical protein
LNRPSGSHYISLLDIHLWGYIRNSVKGSWTATLEELHRSEFLLLLKIFLKLLAKFIDFWGAEFQLS